MQIIWEGNVIGVCIFLPFSYSKSSLLDRIVMNIVVHILFDLNFHRLQSCWPIVVGVLALQHT